MKYVWQIFFLLNLKTGLKYLKITLEGKVSDFDYHSYIIFYWYSKKKGRKK